MLKGKELEMQYKLVSEGLEAVKDVDDPKVKAKLFLGFNAASVLIGDLMETAEKQNEMIDGFINMFKTGGKVFKES